MDKKYKFNFSVIIPIYNVENYLEETIESVINQTLDFKENIEIILVNDGSPDNSETICLKYTKLYPNNIKYVKQKNSGVSTARNNGLSKSHGKYINFLDSDDKWQNNVFEKVLNMFEENNNLDIIGVRQKFFEAQNTYPSLDFKFDHDKIVNIFDNYDHIQLSVTSGFIRRSAIGNIRFDPKVKYSEDAKFLNEIIIKNGYLGIISSSLHYYRKRFSENSAIQTKNSNEDWYLVTPLECYKHAFDLSKKKYGHIIPYFQYYVAYDYQWRIKDHIPNNVSKKALNKYISISKKLFKEIDDYIIISQKNIPLEYKIRTLSLKYNKDISKELTFHDHSLYFKGYNLINLNNYNYLNINIINFSKNNMEIRGINNLSINDDYKLYAVINNKKRILIKQNNTTINIRKSFNQEFMSSNGFIINIPLNNFKSLYFEIKYKKIYSSKVSFKSGISAKIDNNTKNYYIYNDYIYYHYKGQIKRKKYTIKNTIYFFLRYLNNTIKKREFKVLVYRLAYYVLKIFNKKDIWLISDRPSTANDNGYALFKYICNQNNHNIKPFFIITKNSKDYNKVHSTGNILIFNSFKYKVYFLLAKKIISSQADEWVTNPFGHRSKYYLDLYNADFIFLQHGIIIHDLSTWLNCYEKNIKLLVTTTEREYNSVINGKYGFKDNTIKLTGLPRYDDLYNNEKKIIAIMPTWRLNLASNVNKDGIRPYNNNFKNSKYFKFYNNLINDKKLLKVMNNYGYKGVFVVHPSHVKNYIDFKGNNTFEINKEYANYQKLFSEASLLVSDYSSILFDFGFLKKPVLYAQFDKKEFYNNHLYKEGYFNDDKDGFGPISYDYNTTVNNIIKYIKNNCKLEDQYYKRINKFYKYQDHNNCERVYNEILGRRG